MFNSGMTTSEFLEHLREQAYKWKMPPQYIDKIDQLLDIEDLESEIEKLGDEVADLENERNELRDGLSELLEACPEPVDDPGYEAVIARCEAILK